MELITLKEDHEANNQYNVRTTLKFLVYLMMSKTRIWRWKS